MTKMTSPENYQKFLTVLKTTAELSGITADNDVSHYVELLCKSLERKIFETTNYPPKKKLPPHRKFIAIFQQRYLHLTDCAYNKSITEIEGKSIDILVKRLEESGTTMEAYLDWVFDVYCLDEKNRAMMPPTPKLLCSAFLTDKFFFNNREQLKEHKEEQVRAIEEAELMNRYRVLLREYDSPNVKYLYKSYMAGEMMYEQFREGVFKLEREWAAKKAQQVTSITGGNNGNGQGS